MCRVNRSDQISDHTLIEIKLLEKCERNKPKFRQIYVWKNYDNLILCDAIQIYMYSWRYVKNGPMNEKMN